jgi:hypothetical protein
VGLLLERARIIGTKIGKIKEEHLLVIIGVSRRKPNVAKNQKSSNQMIGAFFIIQT